MSKYYDNLLSQLNRLYRHTRLGSYKTRARYYEATQRFCRFLANRYHLQRLANIGPKHIHAYVMYLQDRGMSASTIKTDLAAIRFFHDLMDRPRYQLPSNQELILQRRTLKGVDRTWSEAEFSRMLACALEADREDFVTILYLGRYEALRIHECFRIDRHSLSRAQRELHHRQGEGRPGPVGAPAPYPDPPSPVSSGADAPGQKALCCRWRGDPSGHQRASGLYLHPSSLCPGPRFYPSHDLPRLEALLCGSVVPGVYPGRPLPTRGPSAGFSALGTWSRRCDPNLFSLSGRR